MKKLILLLALVFFVSLLFAQTRIVTGVVKDDKDTTLPGATVRVKETGQTTQTDINGSFRLSVGSSAKTIEVSFVGMKTVETPIETLSSNDVISLSPTTTQLGDVVVIGYGNARKSDIATAVSSISEKDIKNTPVAGADQMLQGKVAGVTVTNNSGQPGGGVSIRVRGVTTATGSNEPLYVIDGVPIIASTSSISQDQLGGVSGQTTQSPLATLNPNDIESISILKDASAQAIYGASGANGVVLITTKKGKSGEGKISYNGYYGWQTLPKRLPIMNLREYATYYNSVVGEGTVNGLDSIPEFKDPSILGNGTDWQDEVFQTGPIQNHQLSFSGGQGKTTYYFSGNYFKQSGIVIGSGFERYALRANIDQQVKDWLKAGISTNLSRSNQEVTLTDGQQSVISLMMYNSPATPVRNFDGTYMTTANIAGVPFGNTLNPVALALLRDVESRQTKAFGNIYVDAQILKGLTFRNQFNYDFQLSENDAYQPRILNSSNVLVIGPSRYREDKNTSFYWGLQSYLTYNRSFGQHNLNVVAGHETAESNWKSQYVSVTGMTKNMKSISAGTIDDSQTGAQRGDWASESFFARLNYNYNNRYVLNASLRREGSASFGPGKRWGTFPAVAAAWNISNEKFAENWKDVSNLRLRLGVGSVGGSNTSGSALYATNIRLIPSLNGLFGQSQVAGVPANVGNPDLGWYSVVTYNAGIDADFFKRRLKLTVDVYKKITQDMILSTVLPSFAGLDPNPPNNSYKEIEPPTTNAGKMTNTGIDIGLNTVNIESKNFSWNTAIVFSHYKNVLNKLNSESATLYGKSDDFAPVTLTVTRSGSAVGSFYGYVTDGLYRTQADIDNGPVTELGYGPSYVWLGDVRYRDLDGNDTLDSRDQTYIGNPNPKFTYSITNTFSYKNFDLSIFLNGSYGGKIYNYSRMQTESLFSVYQNQLNTVLDRYTATNTNGSLPRYNQWNSNNLKISDRFVESGSFLRIQTVSLGYNLPKKWFGKLKVANCRLYASVQNLYTFTKYSGYDPELGSFNGNILKMNIDYGHYPNPRTFTIGANIDL